MSAARRASICAFAVVMAACGDSAGEPTVRPLDEAQTASEPAPAAAGDRSGSGDRNPESPAGSAASAESADGSGSGVLRAEVAELLARYDMAYSELAGEPLAAFDDTSASVRTWHEVVVPGSMLDTQVRGQLLVDAQDNRVLYEPDSNGVLLVSHASDVSVDTDGSLTWRHCAFTPWIEVHADTGAVVDDRPFERWGSGRAVRRGDGSLALAWLSEDELDELPAGSGDPCPTTLETEDPTTDELEVGR